VAGLEKELIMRGRNFATLQPLVALVVFWCGAAARGDDDLSAEEKKQGFVSLFNGKDLTGWRFVGGKSDGAGEAPNWVVNDGVIALMGGTEPQLANKREYGHFELRLQWRAVSEKYSGGICIRSNRNLETNEIGLLFGNEGGLINGGDASGARVVPELQGLFGKWNEWRIVARGDRVTLWCNGKKAWDATGVMPAKGLIGLRAEDAAMEFRRIRIREIKD
jgi:hypothetical protein